MFRYAMWQFMDGCVFASACGARGAPAPVVAMTVATFARDLDRHVAHAVLDAALEPAGNG